MQGYYILLVGYGSLLFGYNVKFKTGRYYSKVTFVQGQKEDIIPKQPLKTYISFIDL